MQGRALSSRRWMAYVAKDCLSEPDESKMEEACSAPTSLRTTAL
ncbi:hypothetical protein [Halobacillus litoralis]|nr:hypothetical protein [Halobacillus litoralis]